jgi:hypothetical protein
VPSPANPPSGCRFHTRCWLRRELGNTARCADEAPALRELAPGHTVSCHFAEDLAGERRSSLIAAGAAHSDARDVDEATVVDPAAGSTPSDEGSFYSGDPPQL